MRRILFTLQCMAGANRHHPYRGQGRHKLSSVFVAYVCQWLRPQCCCRKNMERSSVDTRHRDPIARKQAFPPVKPPVLLCGTTRQGYCEVLILIVVSTYSTCSTCSASMVVEYCTFYRILIINLL